MFNKNTSEFVYGNMIPIISGPKVGFDIEDADG
jgi:hypothetical protein